VAVMASPHDDEISNFQRRKDSADSADDSPCAMGQALCTHSMLPHHCHIVQSSRRVSADLAPIWEGTSPISPLSLPILGHADGETVTVTGANMTESAVTESTVTVTEKTATGSI
jgi:hypothetical protein